MRPSDARYLAFLDELEKISYSVENHAQLMRKSVQAGMPGVSRGVKDALVDGTVSTDIGPNFPLLPWSDPEHAFPNVPKRDITRNIQRKFDLGVKDVARGIVEEDNALIHKGLMDIGSAHHTLVDYEAHSQKPTEMGVEAPGLRRFFKENIGKAGGGWLSLVEHLRTSYDIDKVKPKKWLADQKAIQKSIEFGKSIKPAIVQELVDLGLKKDEAVDVLSKSLRAHKASWTDRLRSSAQRGSEFVSHQFSRATK